MPDFVIRQIPYDSLRITKRTVESKLTQEELWLYYTGVIPDTDKRIVSPFRIDNHITCSFYYKNGNLYLKDWAGHFHGDIYNAICHINHLPYNDLKSALYLIQEDFPKILTDKDRKEIAQTPTGYSTEKDTNIQVQKQLWTNFDVEFWTKRHISSSCLADYEVNSVANLWINGSLRYSYSSLDPAYSYYFGKGRYKIYFPLRRINRFVGNSIAIQGYQQLPEKGDLLIVTKSLKDVMVLRMIGYNAIAFQSESNYFPVEAYNVFKTRFKNIILLYDNDEAGRKGIAKILNQYNDLTYIEIPEDYIIEETGKICKDIDEVSVEYGLEECETLLENLIYA